MIRDMSFWPRRGARGKRINALVLVEGAGGFKQNQLPFES